MKERTVQEIINLGHKNLTDEEIMDMWYDWFCKKTSLLNKGKILLQRFNSIARSNKIDQENTYVWFKNNLPVAGWSYDDFRIADKETGKTLYTIIPKSGFFDGYGEAQVWGRENNFEEPLVKGKWKDVKRFFLNDNKVPQQEFDLSNR